MHTLVEGMEGEPPSAFDLTEGDRELREATHTQIKPHMIGWKVARVPRDSPNISIVHVRRTYLTKQCSALNVAFSHAIKSPPFKLGRVQIAASRIIVFPYSRKIRISHEMNVNFLFSSCGD